MKASPILAFLDTESKHLQQGGLLHRESVLTSPQGPNVTLDERNLVNLASNDYLGLTDHPEMKKAAKVAIDRWGVGLASPRPIAGTLAMHQELERVLARFVGTEEALVFPSGYHANTGLFESLFGERDYIFCDEQIHPSLADGIRLCRGHVYSYRNRDMNHLEDRLKRSRPARFRVIVTDAVFPVLGETAKLQDIYTVADRYGAVVVVDDGQGIGVLGSKAKGSHEAAGLEARIDLVTGTFANALGGGAGGFVAGKKEMIGWLRQKSRPHLTSTALPPAAVACALKALEILKAEPKLRETVIANARFFRDALAKNGTRVIEGEHPAVSVVIGDAVVAQRITDLLYRKGVYAMGFCYPVVPEGDARIRAQVTARHTQDVLRNSAAAFADATKEIGFLPFLDRKGVRKALR